jgi:GNAT acetyltransferase-like protein
MSYEARLLRHQDLDQAVTTAWDKLPPARGTQADFYDSHAWLAAWSRMVGPRAPAELRIPAVMDGDRLVALLPLEARSAGRWASAGAGALQTHRKRYRPVLAGEQPDHEALALLVEEVARAGVRELSLNRLPARDPATPALLQALQAGGFIVGRQERSRDCLALVEGGWADHRRRFAGYDRSIRTKSNRLRALWDLEVEEYGPRTGVPVAEGFALYEELHARSWKGVLDPKLRLERLELLRRTEELGWCRLYVLRVAGVPAAAHIWFRVGEVASWLSTAYDRRLAAVSPGSILMWRAQEQLFAESPPRLLDFMPGDNPQKDRLSPDRYPLLVVDTARRTVVSGVTFPARREVRDLLPRALNRLRRLVRQRPVQPLPAPMPRARHVEVAPATGTLPATRLELDTARRRALAVLSGHSSPEAMAEQWQEGDSWWLVGDRPTALVRLGAVGSATMAALELVLLDGGARSLEALLAAVATAAGITVQADLPANGDGQPGAPIPVHEAVLPWPSPLAPTDGTQRSSARS